MQLALFIPGTPVGAPRMTRADKWKKRPCVTRYRAWKDAARLAAGKLPPPEKIRRVEFVALFPMPDSWSLEKRESSLGTPHFAKPDIDNVCKSLLDALFVRDQLITCVAMEKRWHTCGGVEVRIFY